MFSFNLFAYLVNGVLTYWITVRVGWLFYRNGYLFLEAELRDAGLATSVNNLLLTGYYLLNLGYITLMIWFWDEIGSWAEVLVSVSEKTGRIMLLLGVVHFFNMAIIYLLRNKTTTYTNQ